MTFLFLGLRYQKTKKRRFHAAWLLSLSFHDEQRNGVIYDYIFFAIKKTEPQKAFHS